MNSQFMNLETCNANFVFSQLLQVMSCQNKLFPNKFQQYVLLAGISMCHTAGVGEYYKHRIGF